MMLAGKSGLGTQPRYPPHLTEPDKQVFTNGRLPRRGGARDVRLSRDDLVVEACSPQLRRITMRVKRERSVESVQVVADAEGLSSRAGTALVAAVADRVGLTAALSEALADLRQRRSRRDPGRVVRDLALTLGDGGDCLSDCRVVHGQPPLFGAVASTPPAGG